MLNGNRLAKDFLNKDEMEILYSIGLSNDVILREAVDNLVLYWEKLEEKEQNKKDNKYFKLINKIYDLLPVYGTPINPSYNKIEFDDE